MDEKAKKFESKNFITIRKIYKPIISCLFKLSVNRKENNIS